MDRPAIAFKLVDEEEEERDNGEGRVCEGGDTGDCEGDKEGDGRDDEDDDEEEESGDEDEEDLEGLEPKRMMGSVSRNSFTILASLSFLAEFDSLLTKLPIVLVLADLAAMSLLSCSIPLVPLRSFPELFCGPLCPSKKKQKMRR